MADERQLKDQVAVVTGGSRGIGSAVCEKLAALGASIVVNYARNREAAEVVEARVVSYGVQCMLSSFDVGDPLAVETAFKGILERFGRIDILVNNAGIAIDGLLVRTRNEDWQRTIDVNLSGCFYCARAVAKPMMKARSGRIINISSVIGELGNAGQVAYSASKSGLFGLTKSLSRELASRNITVNAITPGYIQTDMTSGISPEAVEQLLKQIPLNRLGEAADIAEAVAFFALPASGYVTGQILGVNGGMYM
jgi:3-oxoacyl-[acyl-carrier protein] reductase